VEPLTYCVPGSNVHVDPRTQDTKIQISSGSQIQALVWNIFNFLDLYISWCGSTRQTRRWNRSQFTMLR